MSKKAKQILACVALGFVAVFTVTFVVWLSAPKLLNGQFGYVPLASGATGVGLFLLVKLVKMPEEKAEAAQRAAEDYLPVSDGNAAADSTAERENEAAPQCADPLDREGKTMQPTAAQEADKPTP